MKKETLQIRKKNFFKDIKIYTNHHPFVKFLIVLSIFLTYLAFTTIKYGLKQGIMVSILTWTFFVFGTPIADAGILVDFPARLLTGIRMIYSEMLVWTTATIINIITLLTNPSIYGKTILLVFLHKILTTPFPLWIIILLSATGTYFSIYFGDEVLDILSSKKTNREKYEKHRIKHKIIILVSIIVLTIVLYYFLLHQLNLNIPLI